MKIFNVAVLINSVNKTFHYKDSKEMAAIGDVVKITFRGTNVFGVCVSEEKEDCIDYDQSKIKEIKSIELKDFFQPKSFSFYQRFADYNFNSLSNTLKMALPSLSEAKSNQILISRYKIIDSDPEAKLKMAFKTKSKINKMNEIIDIIKNNHSISGMEVQDKLPTLRIKKNLKELLDLMIIAQTRGERKNKNKSSIKFNLQPLNPEQEYVYIKIRAQLEAYKTFLVHGVTGSGKTEIYCHLINDVINAANENKQVLVMLPEIAMTTEIHKRIQSKTNAQIALWHSALSEKERLSIIYRISTGEIKIIIGTRSSVLLPYKNLGMIVVDEEHDTSYKQENSPTYHGRNMAILRGSCENIPVILLSATPSVESYHNAIFKKPGYQILYLNSRHGGASMPKIKIIDTSAKKAVKSGKIISVEAKQIIDQALSQQKQVLIFLNRKGYRRMIKCGKCEHIPHCEDCDNPLAYYKSSSNLKCHYCKQNYNIPEKCQECSADIWKESGGSGIERLTEEVKSSFDGKITTAVLSSDSNDDISQLQETISKIENNEINVIIGTQVVSKGYNFKNLSLAVAVDVESNGTDGDYRVYEKTYQNIVQVAGRSGRFSKNGMMIIQTKNPESKVLKSICSNDQSDFYKKEIDERKSSNLPPFIKEISIVSSSESQQYAYKKINDLKNLLLAENKKHNNIIKILGAVPNSVHIMQKKYRYRITTRGKSYSAINKIVKNATSQLSFDCKKMHLKIDIDPYSFL